MGLQLVDAVLLDGTVYLDMDGDTAFLDVRPG